MRVSIGHGLFPLHRVTNVKILEKQRKEKSGVCVCGINLQPTEPPLKKKVEEKGYICSQMLVNEFRK